MDIEDTRGKAAILSAVIYSKMSGVEVEVSKYLQSVRIFEDVYSPFISCSIVLLDYESIASKFPMAGEEYFYIKFRSGKGRVIDFTFLLYKNYNIGATPTNSLRGMELKGVTLEMAFDRAKGPLTQAYKGTYSGIVAEIFDATMKVDAGSLDLAFEPSRGIVRVIPSFWTPLETIKYCRSRAIASSAVKSPFVFFRNVDGYFFQSLNGLFNVMAAKPEAAIVHEYSSSPLPPDFDERSGNGKTRVDIVDYHIDSYYDTMEKINMGAYSSDSYSFDILTKTFLLNKRFNLSESGGAFQLGGAGGAYNRPKFMEAFNNTRCTSYYTPTNAAQTVDGVASKDFYPDFIGEKSAYSNLLGEYNFRYTMYGDTDVTAGQVMAIRVPKAEDYNDKNQKNNNDKLFTGSFLMTRVEHVITFNSNVDYYMRVSAVNGARDYSVEGVRDE